MSNRRNTRKPQPPYLRWLRAAPRDRGHAYKAWQVAESDRRRNIKRTVPFNERRNFAPRVVAA